MKRIQLTVARLLAEDKKFYHKMLKVRLRKSRRAERSIGRTLTKLILEEADYTAPNPAERITPEMGLDEMLVELFNTQVYEKMKSDAAIDIHPERGIGRDFGVEIALDRDANPELYDCYEAFSNLVLYTAEQDRKIAGIGNRIAETGSDIENVVNSLPMLERERDELDARIKAKRGRRKTEVKIEGLNRELENKRAAIMQTGRTEKVLILKQKELCSEKEKAEDERNCSQRYFLSTIAGSAASAGLSELEDAARKMAGNAGKTRISSDLISYLNESFTESVTQNVVCGIDFPEKRPFIFPNWARKAGAIAAAGVAALVGGIYLLSGGTRSPSQQVMDDYQRFRRGQLTGADLDERYPQGTEEFGIILKNLTADGYIRTGMKVDKFSRIHSSVASSRDSQRGRANEEIIATSRKHEGEFRVESGTISDYRGTNQIVRTKEELNAAVRRVRNSIEGSREHMESVRDYNDKLAKLKELFEESRDTTRPMNRRTGLAYDGIATPVPSGVHGTKIYNLPAGKEMLLNLATGALHKLNANVDTRLWVLFSRDGARDPQRLELKVDEEKGIIDPIWPKPDIGAHLFSLVAAGPEPLVQSTIHTCRMDVYDEEGGPVVEVTNIAAKSGAIDPESGLFVVKAPESLDAVVDAHIDGKEQYFVDLGNYDFLTTTYPNEEGPVILSVRYSPLLNPFKKMKKMKLKFDKELKAITVVPPSEPGEYVLAVDVQDHAGNQAEHPMSFSMHVLEHEEGIFFGVKRSRQTQSTKGFSVANPDDYRRISFFFLAEDEGKKIWKEMKKDESSDINSRSENILPIFPKEATPGNYFLKARFTKTDGKWTESYFKARLGEDGRTGMLNFLRMPAGGNLEEMLTKTQLAKYYLKFDYRLKTDDPAAKWKKIGTIVTTSALDMEVREMARLAVNTRKISLPDDAEPGVYKVAVSRRSGDGYMITAEKSEEGVVKWNIPHEKKQPKKHNPLETMLIGMPPGNATYEFKPAYSTAAGWRTMGMGKDKKVPVFPNTIAPGTYNIRATSNIGAASESKMFEAMVGRDGIVKFVMPVPSKRYQGAVESVTPIPVHPER